MQVAGIILTLLLGVLVAIALIGRASGLLDEKFGWHRWAMEDWERGIKPKPNPPPDPVPLAAVLIVLGTVAALAYAWSGLLQ